MFGSGSIMFDRLSPFAFYGRVDRLFERQESAFFFEAGLFKMAAQNPWPCRQIVQQRWDARRAQLEAKAMLAECVETGTQFKHKGRL